ncbi:MAG: (d)CMP kinase [Rhodospirillaceae bacterium]|nr:(d)CMP kinase [Rhodospirillaceae bacterium]MDE0256190.1 (d)CMP kinase [Rhodospirillaceae bacterium]MDE0617744.1 (d)CMP kinase [Rhodospirillaceae bacterium]MDE0716322.1 (d)CMP kinase [Rhodospirillaceae bacterium]MXY42000.1 (d)CMP kinase [Rhodospirillaceae bacterium]
MSDPPSESVSPLPLVIAVDGPAAAGKGTLARRLAEALDLAHLDSGALYRAVGLAVLRAGGDPADEAAAVAAAASLDTGRLSDPALRAPETGDAASRVAAFPSVRAALLDFQRRFARNPPAGRRGAAIDGRDIGTVVVPDAPVKIFVTASPDERARRRFAELQAAGADVIYPAVLSELEARDGRDSSRAVAPLKPADDAAILDTSTLDAEAAFRAALDIVAQRAPGWRRLVQDVR